MRGQRSKGLIPAGTCYQNAPAANPNQGGRQSPGDWEEGVTERDAVPWITNASHVWRDRFLEMQNPILESAKAIH